MSTFAGLGIDRKRTGPEERAWNDVLKIKNPRQEHRVPPPGTTPNLSSYLGSPASQWNPGNTVEWYYTVRGIETRDGNRHLAAAVYPTARALATDCLAPLSGPGRPTRCFRTPDAETPGNRSTSALPWRQCPAARWPPSLRKTTSGPRLENWESWGRTARRAREYPAPR